jgi:hypothetical protein
MEDHNVFVLDTLPSVGKGSDIRISITPMWTDSNRSTAAIITIVAHRKESVIKRQAASWAQGEPPTPTNCEFNALDECYTPRFGCPTVPSFCCHI